MCAEIRYSSPTASSGDETARTPIATPVPKRAARDHSAWSDRPRRRSRTNACAKSATRERGDGEDDRLNRPGAAELRHGHAVAVREQRRHSSSSARASWA